MKKIKLLPAVILFFAFANPVTAQQNITNYIKVYFTQPVDNTFSNGVNANYVNNDLFDTIVHYIDRAKYTIDIAQYEYQTYTGDSLYTAINKAYARGVKIRYIQDQGESSTNTGVKDLTSTIPVLTSPTAGGSACGGTYDIMHNKFVIIDEYSPDTTQTFVLTGSADWDGDMTTGDYNNLIVFQSKVFARAYTNEFDIMWGDTTHGGATGTGKFGHCKPNSGTHVFHIGGSEVELYFSPSDTTNNHVLDVIKSATTDLYCGMNDFSDTTNAWNILYRQKAGVYAAAILDQYSCNGATPYTTIMPKLGSTFSGYVNSTYLYHNKFLVTNPSAPCDNPMVLTGSFNWTNDAETENDENTVIVHNDTIANLYLQSFAGNFKAISGSALTKQTSPCKSTGINSISNTESQVDIFPNPYKGSVNISYNPAEDTKVTMCVYTILGEKVATLINGTVVEAGQHMLHFNSTTPGVYILQVTEGDHSFARELVQVQ